MGAHSYKKRRNASVIAFSPVFKHAVEAVRSALGIPIEGFSSNEEAGEWHRRHHEGNTREACRPMPRYYWHFPREFVELLESFSYADKPSKVNFYRDVPLDHHAMDLIRRFDLPEEIVDEVKAYILLAHHGSLSSGPTLQLILVPVDEGEEGTKRIALVAGIDEATTQKDWLEVWESIRLILCLSGVVNIPNRRPVDRLLLRDLTFWAKTKEGKTAKEILEEWDKKHREDEEFAEDKEYIGEEAVRKAVERIDEIMHSERAKGKPSR